MLIDFRQLFPKYNIKPNGVLHVGANVGEERFVYRELGIEKQVWIEANPEIYEKLKFNLKDFPEAEAINACITDDDQSECIILHVSNNGSQSSSILNLGTHKTQHPDVHYVKDIQLVPMRLDFYFNNAYDVFNSELDFLNIDIQGAELQALKSLGIHINHFKWIYLEVNKDHVYEGCALLPEIEEYLSQFGFKKAELKWASANLTWGDCLFIK